jgi:hypothetical protein
MTGIIELRKGDLFDGPSDLVVLPCSIVPTVTPFVAHHLQNYFIPVPNRRMTPGEVIIEPFRGLENIATAASVGVPGGTTPPMIKRIGEALGRFTAETASVQIVAAPLLGAGAGGLASEEVVESLSSTFLANCAAGATLRIFVLHQSVFDRLRALPLFAEGSASGEQVSSGKEAPRVLVSYTKTSESHEARIRDLATFLRTEQGINARLDLWHLPPGMDVAQWMCNELDLADRVLLICNEAYAQRADGRHGGVGWEIRLIQGELLMCQETLKYIPVVCSNNVEAATPKFLRTIKCLHWDPSTPETNFRQQLVNTLQGKALESEPPLRSPSGRYIKPF